MTPHIVHSSVLHQGQFLRLEQLEFVSAVGESHRWEAAQRLGTNGAAVILAVLRPSDRLLLIRQYRAPVDRFCLELPAGLVDPGETPEVTAVRELKEETGYTGKVLWCSGYCGSSVGMTGELLSMVEMEVDERMPDNQVHQQNLQDGEEIQVFAVTKQELPVFFQKRLAAGDLLDSRLAAWTMAQGLRW